MAGRTLGFSASLVQANQVAWRWFVRIDGQSPMGTRRFTDYNTGPVPGTVTLNVDGTSQAWTEYDVLVGGLDQGAQGPLSVSFLDFQNMDHTFGNWAESPGLRYAPVYVYHVQFNLDGTMAGPIKMYAGMIGRQEHGERSHLEIMPFTNPFARNGLWLTARDFGAAAFMPDPAVPVP